MRLEIGHYVVNGEVKEGICPDGEWAYLWNDVEHKLLDSVQITNGAFRFEGEVAEPCVAVVKHPFYFNGEKQNALHPSHHQCPKLKYSRD